MNPKTHIRVRCDCGAVLMAPIGLAGRSACCGACGVDVDIPEFVPRDAGAAGPKSAASGQGPVYKSANRGEEGDEVSRKELENRRKKRRRAASAAAGSLHKPTWWIRSLRFPFRTESLITIGVLSVIYGTLDSSVARFAFLLMATQSGRIVSALVIGYFIYFLLDVLRTAAHGQEDLPIVAEWSREDVLVDLFLALGVFAICFLPWGAYRITLFWNDVSPSRMIEGLLLGPAMLYLPMALLSATIHHSFLAVNPVTVLRAIGLTIVDYAIVLALIAVGCLLNWGVSSLISEGMLAGIVAWWGTFTGMTMAMHALGSLYLRNSARLGWINQR
jgi:hypothetical protein